MEKEVVVNFKCEKELRDAFKKATEQNDETMAQVLRAAVREYVKNNSQGSLI